jgi:hypothetical protein
MKNIHILPTDKARLYIHQGKLYDNKKTMHIPDGTQIPHHIYITNDEDIKEGDWFYNTISLKPEPFKACENGDGYVNCSKYSHDRIDCKKIILTTDQYLILDGVQSIDDEFIEWLVKNPSCEEVEIEIKPMFPMYSTFIESIDNPPFYGNLKRTITIPQEEPKQSNNFYEELKHYFEITPREKVLKDWDESAELDKIGPTVEEFLEMTQETIEEADYNKIIEQSLMELRKQPMSFIPDKIMYSEEEVYKLLLKHQSDYRSSVRNSYPLTWSFDIKNWFEQFKKK